jgi:hypothetical protein
MESSEKAFASLQDNKYNLYKLKFKSESSQANTKNKWVSLENI